MTDPAIAKLRQRAVRQLHHYLSAVGRVPGPAWRVADVIRERAALDAILDELSGKGPPAPEG